MVNDQDRILETRSQPDHSLLAEIGPERAMLRLRHCFRRRVPAVELELCRRASRSPTGRLISHGKSFVVTVAHREVAMPNSVYKVVEIVGSSTESWEKAAQTAIAAAIKSLRDVRIAEVEKLDLHLDEKGKIAAYRTRLKLSFKYEGE